MSRRRGQAVENARRADNVRQLRMRERHLNDLDAKQRAVRILFRQCTRAAGELVRRTHSGRARDVDVDVERVPGTRYDRVGVRAAAGLYSRDVLRIGDVADVDDANSARPLVAHRIHHALETAIDAAIRCLGRNEEKIAIHRDVALRPGADVRRLQCGFIRVRDIPHLPAAVVALEDVIPGEREIGVHQPPIAGRTLIQEVFRRTRHRHGAEVPYRLAGVEPTGREADARVR